MPYINPPDRAPLDPSINDLAEWINRSPDVMKDGRLNYVLSAIIRRSILRADDRVGAPRYGDHARAIAALECAKLEIYRVMTGPYEDQARLHNGDIA